MIFKEELQARVDYIEDVLKRYLPEEEGYQKVIMEAMHYSVLAGGKRLRPMLMNETYKLFGGDKDIIEPFMAAMEMIHTYSLVHDDLPAMDNDDYRRGRKTTHIVFGEDIGILTGDALLNYAFETASKAFDLSPLDSYNIGKAIQFMSCKSGIYGMIGGQVVDVKSAGEKIDEEVLEFIYELKTGGLIEASMGVGAILAGASKEEVDIVERIASLVGMAFQIQDDILDVTSTKEVLGKPINSDDKNDKTTFVTYKGLEKSKALVEKYSLEAVNLLKGLEPKDDYLEKLLVSLINREK